MTKYNVNAVIGKERDFSFSFDLTSLNTIILTHPNEVKAE